MLNSAELRLVMTAHPTEARRRTTIDKLARVFGVLRELDERSHAPVGRRAAPPAGHGAGAVGIRRPARRAADRDRRGPWRAHPLLLDAGRRHPADLPRPRGGGGRVLPEADGRPRVPPMLGFGSWIGGDRDGNPFVTPETTVAALELMREQCLRLIESRLEQLAGRLSLSERLTGAAPGLEPILAAGRGRFPELGARLDVLNPEEPYRRALTFMRERIRATQTRARRRIRRAGGAPGGPAAGRGVAADGAGRAHRRRGPARLHPPGGGVRLSLRPPRHPRARAGPPPRAGRGLRLAARLRRLRGAGRRGPRWRCCRPRSPTGARSSPPTSTASPRPPRRRSGRSGRCARPSRAPIAARSRPTSSRAARGPPTSSRCSCS